MPAEVASAFVALMPSAKRFGSQLDSQISGQVEKSGKKAGGALGRGMSGIAKVVGPALGAATVAGFAKKAVGLESAFSQTMNQMTAVAQVPQAQVKKLSDLAIKMGADTVFSANDAASAMLELAKNGIKPAVIQAGALKSALTLAAAGGVSMEEAATTMGNAINAFNLKGSQSKAVAAALAGAANASSASISSLSQGLAQSATGAHQAGLSIQETTAALAAFANAGIQGSDAGTSLKTFLQRLVPQTKKAQEALVAYGLAGFNANKAQKVLAKGGIKMSVKSLADQEKASLAIQKMLVEQGDLDKSRVGKSVGNNLANNFMWQSGIMDSAFTNAKGNFEKLDTISGALKKSLAGLNDQERQTALTTIFGSDASRAAAILMKSGKAGIDKYTKATSDQGAAQRVANSRMKGTAGAIEQLKGSVETVLLRFGQAIAPAVQGGLKLVTAGVNAIPGVFTGIGKTVASIVAKWKITPQGKKITAAFKGFNIRRLGTQLATQAQSWAKPVIDGFKTGLNTGDWSGLGSALGAGVLKALSALGNLAASLSTIFGDLFTKIDWVGIGIAIGKEVPSLLIGLAAGILNFDFMGLLKGLGKHWLDIVLAIVAVAFTPGRIIGKVAEVLARIPLVGRLLAWALTHFKGFSDGLVRMVGRALGFLGRAFMVGFRRVFPTVGKAFGEALRILPTRLGLLRLEVESRALKMVKGIGTWIGKGIGSVVAKIGELIAKMLKPFARFGSLLVNKGKDLVRGLWNGIKGMGSWLMRKVKSFVLDHIPGPIAKVLKIRSPSRVMAAQAKFIPLGMVKGIESQHHVVDRAMGRLGNRIALHAPTLEPSALGATSASARGGTAIRGTLGIDRDGVAYIHGVSRDEVHHHAAAQQASDRAAAMSL